MKHKMKLDNRPFELIKRGTKTIELRLYDEKRQLLNKDDIIFFENRITHEIVMVKVVAIHKFGSFEELYNSFDKVLLGYDKDEYYNPHDMDQYYSKEEQEKYGVVGIEIDVIDTKTKEIVHNSDYLSIDDINNVVRRAKILIENDNNEIILCYSNNNYFLLGGHVDSEESDVECLHRELLEEAGNDIPFDDIVPFMTIKYLNKDYPKDGLNTFTMANYYWVKYNFVPNYGNINLTDGEKKGGFVLKNIAKDKVIDILTGSLKDATKEVVTLDTIKVLESYFENN